MLTLLGFYSFKNKQYYKSPTKHIKFNEIIQVIDYQDISKLGYSFVSLSSRLLSFRSALSHLFSAHVYYFLWRGGSLLGQRALTDAECAPTQVLGLHFLHTVVNYLFRMLTPTQLR